MLSQTIIAVESLDATFWRDSDVHSAVTVDVCRWKIRLLSWSQTDTTPDSAWMTRPVELYRTALQELVGVSFSAGGRRPGRVWFPPASEDEMHLRLQIMTASRPTETRWEPPGTKRTEDTGPK